MLSTYLISVDMTEGERHCKFPVCCYGQCRPSQRPRTCRNLFNWTQNKEHHWFASNNSRTSHHRALAISVCSKWTYIGTDDRFINNLSRRCIARRHMHRQHQLQRHDQHLECEFWDCSHSWAGERGCACVFAGDRESVIKVAGTVQVLRMTDGKELSWTLCGFCARRTACDCELQEGQGGCEYLECV